MSAAENVGEPDEPTTTPEERNFNGLVSETAEALEKANFQAIADALYETWPSDVGDLRDRVKVWKDDTLHGEFIFSQCKGVTYSNAIPTIYLCEHCKDGSVCVDDAVPHEGGSLLCPKCGTDTMPF